ncbi:DUF998 domain-containing protein [Trujillonella endophytica]|uniref:Hypothetical membrane protein n=1 Tax=Trujillonella endophytica TaxID=673521 RepID=A0A1H8TV36_9ACTN|nr:DUF998 domain-containing protein [Trujillella endophytica]SEO94859.1 hypothetical membrane protein [Trujillella endophytica]
MAGVTSVRLRLGALLWLLTLQFFVVEAVAAARYDGYSRTDLTISLLGASTSPAQVAMNVSFVAQGLLIAGGLLLLRPALSGRGTSVVTAMLSAAALGVIVVGTVPLGDGETWHELGAFLYLVGGGLGLIGLAYAVRHRSEALGTILVLLGLVATAMTVFYLAAVTGYLGEGGTERAAAYPLPVGLALAAVGLVLLARRPAPADGEPDRRARKEQERAERARMAEERDAALEAAAARAEGRGGRDPEPARDADDDFDPDDPWATPRRRDDT